MGWTMGLDGKGTDYGIGWQGRIGRDGPSRGGRYDDLKGPLKILRNSR
jgi:hypothetical protein